VVLNLLKVLLGWNLEKDTFLFPFDRDIDAQMSLSSSGPLLYIPPL